MAYVLDAVVARESVARAFAERLPSARSVALSERLALVPLTPDVISELAAGERWDLPLLMQKRVPASLAGLLEDVSRLGPIAYLEAEFFGGEGCQAAVLWHGGEIVLGPIVEEEDGPENPRHEWAFNQALRLLGVRVPRGGIDEFDTAGLGRHRFTEDWLKRGD